jgi:hypothetical protein
LARQKTREEKLFGAAVLRRSLALRGEAQERALGTVYQGVLRDLGLRDEEVLAYLAEHGAAVDAAIGRGRAG